MISTAFCLINLPSPFFWGFHNISSPHPPFKNNHLLLLHHQKVGSAWSSQRLIAFYHTQVSEMQGTCRQLPCSQADENSNLILWYMQKNINSPQMMLAGNMIKLSIEANHRPSIWLLIPLLNCRQWSCDKPRIKSQKALKVKTRTLCLLWCDFSSSKHCNSEISLWLKKCF